MISRNPQRINKLAWYYENKRGIEICYQIFINDKYLRTDSIRIPFHKLNRSLNRMK